MYHHWLCHHLSMTKPLLAILLLLPLSVSAGELDGKAISCDPLKYGSKVHFEFEDGKVKQWGFIEVGTQMTLVFLDPDNLPTYRTSPREITWRDDNSSWSLNRASLQLERSHYATPSALHTCEVYVSITEFKAMLKARKLDMQRAIDEQMKNNKI